MAAAGTLSRPTSAQGSYSLSPYHTYYSPPSPTIAGTYSRPSSAGANYASESYSPFRKSTTRPVISRLATSSQYIPSTSPDAPTRIYGTRSAIHSADDLSATTLHKATPVQLQRNYTAPDLRPLIRGPNRQLNKLQTLDINSSQSDKFAEGKERTTPVPKQNTVDTTTTTTTSDLPTGQLKRASRTGPFEDVGIELAPPVTQEPGAKDDTSSPPSRGFVTSTTSVQEDLSDFAPLTGHPMPPLTTIGQTDSVVEDSNGAAKVQTSAPPSSSEATILKDIHSGNDLDSDAQLSALLPPGTPATDQGKYEELSNMRLPPRSQTPVPANYLSPEKSKSLKNRLRRALSLGSSSKLSEYGTDEQLQNFQATPVPVQRADHIYGQRNRSMDNISVASNASSASMILRKLSHGLTKKTKRSFSSLFSGSRSNYATPSGESVEAPQPRVSPVVGNVNYINAEPRPDDRPQSPQREIFNSHTRAQGSMSTNRSTSVPAKVEVTQAASNVDGHGSVAFPRLSEEMAIDEDRSRRASMHLERPLPIDLAEHSITPVNETSEASLSSSFGLGRPDHIGSISKGILKRSRDIQGQSPQAQSKDVTPPTAQADHGFDFSFDPVPEIAKFSLSANELTPPSTTPTAQTTPTSVITPIVQASKTGGPLKFSPRITIHDTYTANEYDRRGELATCNRLTPLLAQRIKEELNAYKMDEMQVAEESKMYTHFFS